MPKRELSKCRVWEKERRERLKTCFDALSKLLPSYDPSISPSKLEILQRAASHIQDLQQKNKQLLHGDQKNASIAQRDEVRRLRDKCRKLNIRSEQLCSLLKSAGIKIPKEYLGRPQSGPSQSQTVFKGPPKLWSGRITKEKAEVLKKQHENDHKITKEAPPKTRKRKRLSSPKKSENVPPNKKPNIPPKKSPQNIKKVPKKQTFSSDNLASKVAPILGPGTLILANGSVVPVPPAGTLHRIQLLPTVPPTAPQNSIILMPQQNSNINTKNNTSKSKLATIRPKTGGGAPRSVPPVKVAIPPLPKRKTLAKKGSKVKSNNSNESNKDLGAKKATENGAEPPKTDQKRVPNSPTEGGSKNPDAAPQKLGPNGAKTPEENDKNAKIPEVPSKIHDVSNQNIPKKNQTTIPPVPPLVETGRNLVENGPKLVENILENDQNLVENMSKINESEVETIPPLVETVPPMVETGPPLVENTETNINLMPSKLEQTIDNLETLEPQEMPPNLNLKPQNPPEGNTLMCDPQNETENLGEPDEHSELSNDIFASLGGNSGVIGGQHTESMSPTAAFLLAFPLVSTLTGSRNDPQTTITAGGNGLINSNSGTNNNDRNESTNDDDRQSTPTTLLQIGGNMTLDKSRTLLQIGDTLNKRFSDLNDDHNKNRDQKYENYNFFPQNTTPQNTYLPSRPPGEDLRPSKPPPQQEMLQNYPQTENKEPLISSVLQVSHACLYEQKSANQTGNNFYPYLPEAPQNFPPNSTPKDKKNRQKNQNTRAPVNWMTTPDIRPGFPEGGTSGVTSDYFLPPFSDVYSGISSAISTDIHQSGTNNSGEYSWTSGGNRGVLPTLLGDLALGVTVGNTSAGINTGIYTNTTSKTNTNNFSYNYDSTNLGGKETSGGFLSVSSMLVEGKTKRNHPQGVQHKRREKTKHKNNEHNFGGNLENKKYSGGYSAEDLIGETQYNPPNANIPNYSLNEQFYQHKNQQNQSISTHQNPPNTQANPQRGGQTYQQRHQGGAYGSFPPNHGEFSALLSAAVVDTYSKTFDSFVHVKPPHVPPNGGPTSYDTFGARPDPAPTHRAHQPVNEPDRRRHRSPRAGPPVSRDHLAGPPGNTGGPNTSTGFSELSFLSMSGAVSSPILPEEFHSSTPFLNAPPPLPTPVASSLTNFNLSAIFPEINKSAAPPGPPVTSGGPVWGPSKPPRSQTRYQNHQQHSKPYGAQQGSAVQTGPHDAIYGAPGTGQAFPGILHDGNGGPTNFSFSFGAP